MGNHIMGAPFEPSGTMPADQMPMPHPGKGVDVKGAPAPVKSTGKDSFATDQPRNKTDVKSGQGSI